MKLLKVLVAAAVLAAMVTPAIAEDRLSLSGEMRVRGWHTDNDADDYTNTWGDQRLRVGGKISVAEGVSITFRTDITESTWGSGNKFGSGREGSTQQWDRAHIDLTKGDLHLRAGQFLTVYGNQFVDNQKNGLSFDVNGSVPVNVFFMVQDDGNTAADADFIIDQDEDSPTYGTIIAGDPATTGDDAFVYGVQVKPMSNLAIFAGGFSDDDTAIYGAGAKGSFDFDAIKVAGELNFFGGDATDTVDARGIQGMLDVSTALDAATVGLQGYYAAGEDDDVQVTTLGNAFNGWDPIMDVGTGLSNEAITFGNPYDFTGEGAGVVGGRLYANTMVGETKLGASIAYLATEEDKVEDVDGIALAAGFVYPILDNTSFQAQLQYLDFDDNATGSTDDLEEFQAGTGIFVAF